MSAADKPERWLPIESNPDVMNSFLAKLGVPQDWQVNPLHVYSSGVGQLVGA